MSDLRQQLHRAFPAGSGDTDVEDLRRRVRRRRTRFAAAGSVLVAGLAVVAFLVLGWPAASNAPVVGPVPGVTPSTADNGSPVSLTAADGRVEVRFERWGGGWCAVLIRPAAYSRSYCEHRFSTVPNASQPRDATNHLWLTATNTAVQSFQPGGTPTETESALGWINWGFVKDHAETVVVRATRLGQPVQGQLVELDAGDLKGFLVVAPPADEPYDYDVLALGPDGCHLDGERFVMTAGPGDRFAVPIWETTCDVPSGTEESVEEPVAAASAVGVDREDCRVTRNASVRGVTGTFASAEAAARSVEGLPAEGRLVYFELHEDSATFAWVARGVPTHIIDTHRGDGGWAVGSYQKCGGS